MKRNLFLFFWLISIICISCGKEAYLDIDGNYKKQIYFIQNGTTNGVLSKNITSAEIYKDSLAVYCSGVSDIKDPVLVKFEIDNTKLAELNASEKAQGKKEYLSIPNQALKINNQVRIDKGDVSGLIPIEINPSYLTPDVNYMLVLTIMSASDFSINKKMESIFYCVKLNKNVTPKSVEKRVIQFQSYQNPELIAKTLKTSTYSKFENPTGIFYLEGDKIVLEAKNIGSVTPYLKITNFGKNETGTESRYPIRNGINEFVAQNMGNSYIEYWTTDEKRAPIIEINFTTGQYNGVFDSSINTNEDWKNLLQNAKSEVIDIVGRKVQLAYPVNELKLSCPDKGLELINLYDYIIDVQHEMMGLKKYNFAPRNRMFGRVIWSGFMHADGIGAAFVNTAMSEVANIDKIKENPWGIAHEFGHVNQVRPNMKWVGTTEVTNNIYSVWTQFLLNPQNPKFEREDHTYYDNFGKTVICGRFNSYMESAFIKKQEWLTQGGPDDWLRWHADGQYWHGDHFVKLIPLWQLQLYFAVAGKGNSWYQPDLYADVFIQAIRDVKTYTTGEHQLNFMKRVCDVTRTDLSTFFEKIGMLVVIDKFIGDYTSEQLTITQNQVNEFKTYVSKYPKPHSPNIEYISANSVNAFKDNTGVIGNYNLGLTLNNLSIIVDHQIWRNVAAFETYKDNILVKVAIAGTGSKSNSSTLVQYPEGSTRVEAVGCDGKRVLVYGKR